MSEPTLFESHTPCVVAVESIHVDALVKDFGDIDAEVPVCVLRGLQPLAAIPTFFVFSHVEPIAIHEAGFGRFVPFYIYVVAHVLVNNSLHPI